MKEKRTFVIVPTYNEADNLDELISQLLALPVDLSVVVVDDNSPDGTGQLADNWSANHPDRVAVIHRAEKLGLGTAYIAGFKYTMVQPKASSIMTMDADFSHNPRYIPEMIAAARHNHVIIGSRYAPGGGSRNCSWKRIALSKAANLFARSLLGLRAHDVTAGFRLYRREALETIPLDQIFSNGYSFLIEMLFLCKRRGWQVGEVPIIFEDRRMGTTKISRQEIFKAQYTVFRLFLRRLRRTEPRRASIPVKQLD
jgi:glycosyltransferase involved in cell wall biosynthesis